MSDNYAFIGLGMALGLGLGLGAMLGALAFDDIPMGVAIGFALGALAMRAAGTANDNANTPGAACGAGYSASSS